MRTCVTPHGYFLYGIHEPDYRVTNLRGSTRPASLGRCGEREIKNKQNYPDADLTVEGADPIYEIPNAFPFRGTTFINSRWAHLRAGDPLQIRLEEPAAVSFTGSMRDWQGDLDDGELDRLFSGLPEPVLLALATTSTDPLDLVRLARLSASFVMSEDGMPAGLEYRENGDGRLLPLIRDHSLFEAVANNPHLPDPYKEVMVLRPGAQGGSEIVGEYKEGGHHVFEYLRRNSYIPWGHYAANMADDAIRYDLTRLGRRDMEGLRHLYYQRTYVRLAEALTLPLPASRTLSPGELEELRRQIVRAVSGRAELPYTATLWGWNYGFDFAPSGYRLNASHQQIHQQYALLPSAIPCGPAARKGEAAMASYGCGDQVAETVIAYDREHGRSFFEDYLTNIRNNRRMDGRDGEASLIVHEDENCLLFVPKAQVSQWELQLMSVRPQGNILEADTAMRRSLDRGIFIAMQTLRRLGVKMVTTIEYPKRFGSALDQRLIYSFLPKLPYSPGAFSEAQLRWICGHFPEDFAAACRHHLPEDLD